MIVPFVRIKQNVVLLGLVIALAVTGAAPLLGGHGADAKKGKQRNFSAESGASPALVQQFANPTQLPMGDDQPAFPSEIEVSGFTTPIAHVEVQLLGITYGPASTQDMDVLLIGPEGRTALIVSDVGGNTATGNVNLLLRDDAPEQLPSNSALSSCTCQPTNIGSPDSINVLGPDLTPPSGSALAVFNGLDPNGTWSLIAADDDGNGNTGLINGGWILKITTANGVPTAEADSFQAQAGKSLTVPADGVLGNDADSDGDSLQAIVAGQPKQGILNLQADGGFTYRPKKKAKGTDSFTYLAEDPSGLNALATVDIHIKAKKDKKKGKGGKKGKK
jgi:hypothetical protein